MHGDLPLPCFHPEGVGARTCFSSMPIFRRMRRFVFCGGDNRIAMPFKPLPEPKGLASIKNEIGALADDRAARRAEGGGACSQAVISRTARQEDRHSFPMRHCADAMNVSGESGASVMWGDQEISERREDRTDEKALQLSPHGARQQAAFPRGFSPRPLPIGSSLE